MTKKRMRAQSHCACAEERIKMSAVWEGWLLVVSRKLSRDEFHLLKALYLKTLGLRTLQDRVREPQDHVRLLYDLPQELSSSSVALPDDHVSECGRLTQRQSFALFVHRIQILVPTTDQSSESDTRSSGAKDCIASLERSLGALPSAEGIETAPESKLVECLVKRFVNMDSLQQGEMKKRLASCVGLNLDTANLFDLFSELIVKRNNFDSERIVGQFVDLMPLVRCSRIVYRELEEDLLTNTVPHDPIPIPGIYIVCVHSFTGV